MIGLLQTAISIRGISLYIKRPAPLIASLASWLLVFLLISAFFLFRGLYSIQAGSGVVYVFLSVCLGSLATNVRFARWFLTSAYLSLLIGLLNQFIDMKNSKSIAHYYVPIASICVLLFWLLFCIQLWIPFIWGSKDSPDVAKKQLSRILTAVAISSLLSGGLSILSIFLIMFLKEDRIYVPWEPNPFVIAMVFVAVFSGCSAAVLIRTSHKFGLSSGQLAKGVFFICLILAMSGIAEYLLRRDWTALVLSGVTLMGCVASFWESYSGEMAKS